jgi:hypothetical protein
MSTNTLSALRRTSNVAFFFTFFFFVSTIFSAAYDERHIQEFHECLKRANPDLFRPGCRAYYKKIGPFTSTPPDQQNRWLVSSVTVAGNEVMPNAEGVYSFNGVLFRVVVPDNFNDHRQLSFAVRRDTEESVVECAQVVSQEKRPILPQQIKGLEHLLAGVRENRIWSNELLTLRGMCDDREGSETAIDVVVRNMGRRSLRLEGMEVAYDEHETHIFLDLVDEQGHNIHDLRPCFTSQHHVYESDKKIFSVNPRSHQIYARPAREITREIFDSLATQQSWVPDGNGFYDQIEHREVSLPTLYLTPGYRMEQQAEPLSWVVEPCSEAPYEQEGEKVLENSGDYVCMHGEKLYSVLKFKARFKEYPYGQNSCDVHLVERVARPSLSIADDTSLEGMRHEMIAGAYARRVAGDSIVFEQLGNARNQLVFYPRRDDANKGIVPVFTGRDEMSVDDAKRWCHAAQALLHSYHVQINRCDRELIQQCSGCQGVCSLDFSNLKIVCKPIVNFTHNDVTFRDVLSKIGTMKQLKRFCFCNNCPIVDLYENYSQMADRCTDLCLALAACIGELPNLEELQIQGLLLKPGVAKIRGRVSYQMSILTGIINHKQTVGVSAIMKSICGHGNLRKLCMDGIPEQGTFLGETEKNIGTVPLIFWFTVGAPISWPATLAAVAVQGIETCRQSDSLCALSTKSADDIAAMQSLQSVCIYSPRGDASDYFSKFFKERMAASRVKNSQLRPLEITSAYLEDC